MSLFDKLFSRRNVKPEEDIPAEPVNDITDAEEPAEDETAETAIAAEVAEEAAAEAVVDVPASDEAAAAICEAKELVGEPDIKKKLLIADNSDRNRKELSRILNGDYDIIFSDSGDGALNILREKKSDISLVLLDVTANGRKGMDTLRTIKNNDELRQLPVAVLASDADSEIRSLCMGAIDFIPVPFPDDMIVRARIDRCAELSESRDIIRFTERDRLTSQYNVYYFEHYVNLFDRHYPDTDMDAIAAVISNYSMINKHYGRKTADAVMRRIGDAITDYSEKNVAYGCRSGEDSFYIYCRHTDDYNSILNDLSSGIDSDPSIAGKARLCLGVYPDADKSIPIEKRYEYAGIAAHSVINSYTDRIGIYDSEMKEAALFREQILGEFIPSLNDHRFKIYFQPKFDIRGDKPVLYSAEALVRWDHPQLGMMSPGKFIGLLEENGLITQLDRYVWSEAAAQIRQWKDKFGYSVPVSVNISHIDMLLPLLKNIFKEIIQKYSLSDDDIILEITESAYDSENDQILSAAQELRGMGLGMRIEVGGANYSSLGTLSHMPIDALKIDMKYVHNSLGDNKDMGMIELIIDIADYLHVPVLAEGVETEEQYLLLKALGCDLVQGFYFSKPVPKEDFVRFIMEGKSATATVVPDSQSSYVSISKALTGEYERIFYIDINNDHYMQFYSGSNGEFRIHTGGKDFFADTEDSVLKSVVAEDRDRIKKLLNKKELMEWTTADKTVSTHFKRADDGKEILCTLETIRTRNQDDHHIVIGIRRTKSKN